MGQCTIFVIDFMKKLHAGRRHFLYGGFNANQLIITKYIPVSGLQ